MGDINSSNFVRDHKGQFQGPFLEVGSRDYGSTSDLATLFPGQIYIRADMSAGESVDHVIDMTLPFNQVDSAMRGTRFGTIFCLCVMEHCDHPFKMAENLTRLLRPGGKICISVPFAWKFHSYPSDYWRFTYEGVKKLFPDLDFNNSTNNATTSRVGESYPLDEDVGRIHLSGGPHRKNGHFLRGVSADLLRLARGVGVLRWLVGYRYVLAPTLINMIGVRPEG